MPDQFSPEFKPEVRPQDVEILRREVEKHREAPEAKGFTEQQLLKKAIVSITPISGGSQSSALPGVLPDYAQSASPEVKLEIEALVEAAFTKGVIEAANEASKSSAFVLDAFHDALTDKLYPELQKRGILK
ncbi:MAG: Uncharacterized protein G01um101420_506 [Parcubacteria group bacterium Gr01-1014_20]|nr:MAG: Uncharacterized protein G01um101420_506 [Parcubacteria group bacterium Gr01-1014_20]